MRYLFVSLFPRARSRGVRERRNATNTLVTLQNQVPQNFLHSRTHVGDIVLRVLRVLHHTLSPYKTATYASRSCNTRPILVLQVLRPAPDRVVPTTKARHDLFIGVERPFSAQLPGDGRYLPRHMGILYIPLHSNPGQQTCH